MTSRFNQSWFGFISYALLFTCLAAFANWPRSVGNAGKGLYSGGFPLVFASWNSNVSSTFNFFNFIFDVFVWVVFVLGIPILLWWSSKNRIKT